MQSEYSVVRILPHIPMNQINNHSDIFDINLIDLEKIENLSRF